MPDAGAGSEPKPGAPAYFLFDGVDIAAQIPGLGPFVSAALLDVPTLPQLTADFCSVGPPTDMPTDADWPLLAMPVIGMATGSYHRVGNLVKANKWADLCQWKAAQTSLPKTGYCNPDTRDRWIFNLGTVPAGAKSVTITLFGVSGRAAATQTYYTARIMATDQSVPSQPITRDTQTGALSEYQETLDTTHVWHWNMGSANWTNPVTFYVESSGPPEPNQCVDVQLQYVPADSQPTTYTPPPPLATPPDYPTVGPCDNPSMSDLCKAIAAIDARVRWIADQLVPPELTPDDNVTTPEPDPGTGGLKPLDKPPSAVGAIISATTIPGYAARYGNSPIFYPAIGHVALALAEGPLPSQLIKHSPMILAPIPAQVKSVMLDAEQGVSLAVRWLYPPKEGPSAKPPA